LDRRLILKTARVPRTPADRQCEKWPPSKDLKGNTGPVQIRDRHAEILLALAGTSYIFWLIPASQCRTWFTIPVAEVSTSHIHGMLLARVGSHKGRNVTARGLRL
jgi:hypothetical protein